MWNILKALPIKTAFCYFFENESRLELVFSRAADEKNVVTFSATLSTDTINFIQ